MDSDDEYVVQDFSDEGGIDSSDDDELVMKEFEKQSTGRGSKKLIDDFEADMRDELELRASNLQTRGDFQIPGTSSVKADKSIDAIGLDSSDSSDEDGLNLNKEKLTNADLFYDPEMDSKDEAWVRQQRTKYQLKSSKIKIKPLPNSDAVLNCPACFTSLSRDCQRHEIYKSQYRAMFTFNCTVDKSTIMKFPFQSKKGNKTRSEQPASEECRPEEDEKYHPVRCSVCDTQVGVFDKDEVFHFFNVVTSH